ncbi:MFS transporter [Fimbriiglobus ruber]|uniref:Nitrate/nitrite transporter n=1 Tax=Fimbriiglobus ruber TaxID=1908690 RepID=A0A225DXI8_9BACT|nr:MFS transporter [Fimbriiglobus ruber]OWK41949.1 Nitrate/nitrite transporter [Fimbriiglobus ruber]
MFGTIDPPDDDTARGVARAARRKVAWRVLPLVFLLYVVAYLDRANVGFAKLQMQGALGFDDDTFGSGIGIFFIGYLFLEIPGALLVEHWSARKWFARILITWGFCSMGMALVTTPTQFYIARFLLGLAEAGFFPGIIVYFTHWFPRPDRARALAVMLVGVPLSLALGSAVSGLLLEQGWFGLAGWQWVFIVEGAPAVVFGVALPFLLTDRPAQARWLTPDERAWLEKTLEAERREVETTSGAVTIGRVARMPAVWLLALGIFATNTGGYAMVFWLPTAVQGLLTSLGRQSASADVLVWTGLVYLCGFLGVLVSGHSSDRTGDRKWHCVVSLVGAGVFLALSTVPGQPWALVFIWLCLTGFCANFWISPFWVLPTQALSSSAAAVSIGFINMSANLAGFLGSKIVGRMKYEGLDDRACLLFLAACFALGGGIVALLRVNRRRE